MYTYVHIHTLHTYFAQNEYIYTYIHTFKDSDSIYQSNSTYIQHIHTYIHILLPAL
jgi:hypothetical protein